MNSIRNIALLLFTVSTVAKVCAQEKGFKKDVATGVQYRFIKHDKKGKTPGDTDFARVVMLWKGKNVKGDADSVFLDSHKRGGDSLGSMNIPLKRSFHGCLEQGISMMAVGDSAVFLINADSLYLKTFHAPPQRIPAFIKPSTMFTFSIKLLSFKNTDEMMAERQEQLKKRMAKMEARKEQENADITAYLQKNNYNVKPDEDSIFYLQTTKGTGAQVQDGDSVVVKYKGTFLDGGVFDPGTQPYKLMYSKNASVIQGWISVLGKISQGDKMKVLIPSKMGYGARGGGPIQPYTPLIFDMEIISVKSNK